MKKTLGCKQCKTTFKRQLSPSNLRGGMGKYCSRKCSALAWKEKYHQGEIKISLEGLKLGRGRGRKHTAASRKKISESLKGLSGPLARNWQGGKTEENWGARWTTKYKKWAKQIKERDRNECQFCGVVKDDIEAHHIKRFSKHKSLRFKINNGISLCKNCHLSIRSAEKDWESYFQFNLETRFRIGRN